MERRLILAIALSFLVLFISSKLMNKTTIQPPLQGVSSSPLASKSGFMSLEQEPQKPTTIETLTTNSQETCLLSDFEFMSPESKVIFGEPQAEIKEIIFNNYQFYRFSIKSGLLIDGKPLVFKRQSAQNNEIVYVCHDQDKDIIKHFLFSKSNYDIKLEIIIRNLSSSDLRLKLPLVLGVTDVTLNKNRMAYWDVRVAEKDAVFYPNIRKQNIFNSLKFIGLRDRYFCAIIEPQGNYTGFISKVSPNESKIGIVSPELYIASNKELKEKFHIYLGPQDLKLIKAVNPDWQKVVHYGKLNFIAQILLRLLDFFFGFVHNWGWAIIILSLTIYILLWPLTIKQLKSMREMQILQPKIEEIRQLYKNNPQRLNKEIMQLYREHKVNPFGGCLPLILQIPIFFTLYQVLCRSIALKGANFLWIKDLSEPDHLFKLPFQLLFLGQYFNLLPILMAIGMFIQQKISTGVKISDSHAEQQKIMLIIFPVMFGVLFYNMPAGLVLYWFINSLLALGYQLIINRGRFPLTH